MKNITDRIKHWPSTLLGLALFGLVAWLHFSGRVLISEWEEFITGAETLIALVAARYVLFKPKGFAAPPDEEPAPPTTPFPNPTTPRPPKK